MLNASEQDDFSRENEGPVDAGDKMFDPESSPPTTWSMAKLFTKIAVPAVFTNTMAMVTVVINAIFAGRMNDPAKMAAVGLTNVTVMIFILSIMIGLNAAQETLTSQAFGYGNYHMCGNYLNRGRFILMAFFIPCALIPAMFAE